MKEGKIKLDKKPKIVVNLEPIHEFYDSDNLSDFIALNYHNQRNYFLKLDKFL